MKRRLNKRRIGGFTVVEVLACLAVVAVLAAILLPGLARGKTRHCRINCVSNLKQVGLAFRMWSNDHGDQFPWAVPTADGGSQEFASTPDVFPHYNAISNELNSPKILACVRDFTRAKATSWDQLTNNKAHLSYFVGLSADESRPQMILSGDRNLTVNGRLAAGLVTVASNTVLGVAPLLHTNHLNVGLADGSAQQVTAAALQRLNEGQFASITNQAVRLAIP